MAFVLYKIYNIIFEQGFDPPPSPVWTMLKKTALFFHVGFPYYGSGGGGDDDYGLRHFFIFFASRTYLFLWT